jgi:hypothetical protein
MSERFMAFHSFVHKNHCSLSSAIIREEVVSRHDQPYPRHNFRKTIEGEEHFYEKVFDDDIDTDAAVGFHPHSLPTSR